MGIIPFDPSVVFDKLGSGASYIEADPFADIYDQTPDHSDNDLSDPQTPKNLSALLQASYEIEAQYPKFVKGALACARESELLSDQLALTKAAENARKVRANQSKHYVQKGRSYSGGSMQKNDFRAKGGRGAIGVGSSEEG